MSISQGSLFAEFEEPSTEDTYGEGRRSLLWASEPLGEDSRGAQEGLFDRNEFSAIWAEWRGMPQYSHADLRPYASVIVHLSTRRDLEAFEELIEQKPRRGGKRVTASYWWPKPAIRSRMDKRYVDRGSPRTPRWPVFILSKGRWETPLTARVLDRLGVPYRVVVEPQERENYADVIDSTKLLTLPFSNRGAVPVRNWIWEQARELGVDWHWVLDDNIRGFYRFNHNLKIPVASGTIFAIAEDFVGRYENVAEAGFNYFMFAPELDGGQPPFYLNTRVYSCILLRTGLYETPGLDGEPIRWRGRFNEDTDLSLQLLKAGYSTVLLNAFLAEKQTTLTMKGGNTEAYQTDGGRTYMAQELADRHPDVARVAWKWHRWQHQVDYSPFRNNPLGRRTDYVLPDDDNEFGMVLEQRFGDRWEPVEAPILEGGDTP